MKIKNFFKTAIIKVFGSINVLLCLPLSCIHIIRSFSTLRQLEIIVFMPEGGFGHTITGPDLARRFFKGKRCAFIAFSEFNRHNRKVASIWPDIFFLFLPLSVGVKVGSRPIILPLLKWYKKNASLIVLKVLRFINTSFELHDNEELYKRTSFSEDFAYKKRLPKNLIDKDWCNSCVRVVGYLNLTNTVSVSEVHLPEKWRKKIKRRIQKIDDADKKQFKLCGMYLRQKGRDSKDISSLSRCGSRLEEYVPAIQFLNSAGYLVLLMGDEAISEELRINLKDKLIDYSVLGVDRESFELFVSLETDIFISEAGGGAWLSGFNGIPRLFMNAFPLGYGQQNSWVFYKTVTDKDGKMVDAEQALVEHEFRYDFKDYLVHSNNAEELRSAVASFLEDIKKPQEYDPGAGIVSKLSEYSWIKQSHAKISPAWLKIQSCRKEKYVQA
ncbi:TIGR04372 family glycosyltransferase [Candidatus Omnitrophota bacterium]